MLGLGLAAVFIALNGFFVAAEFALVKLRATSAMRRRRDPREPEALTQAVERLDRYLGVTQLAITLNSLGLGWVGEPAVAHVGGELAESLLGRPLGPTGEGVVFGVAFALLTLAHVLFGELIPKLVAIQRSREAAAIAAPVLRAVYVVLWPALALLELCSRAVLRLVGLPFDTHGEAALSEDEILGVLAATAARGKAGEAKQELLRRVVLFSQRTAKSAMVPRVDVVAMPTATSGREAVEILRHQQYSRVLLTRGTNLDEVAGYLYAKDLLFDPEAAALTSLDSVCRTVPFVPESQGLGDVLREMQRTQTHFAVVVDEYGGTSGIVTMEDLLEEIVGEIKDELDREPARVEKRGDAWDVDAGVTLDELRTTGLEPPAEERSESIGAVVVERLRRLPRVGDRVEVGGMAAEILAVSRRRVTRVRLRAAPAEGAT